MNLTFTSKEGLKSLSLDRNLDGVSRCNEGSFWSGCPAGETGTCRVCCDITAWKALLWKRFISKGVTAVFLCVPRHVAGCSGASESRFTPFAISVSKLGSGGLKKKERNKCEPLTMPFSSNKEVHKWDFYLIVNFHTNSHVHFKPQSYISTFQETDQMMY